jgi:hypothetical protein
MKNVHRRRVTHKSGGGGDTQTSKSSLTEYIRDELLKKCRR